MVKKTQFRLPNKVKFRQALLAWFAEQGRDLPWRHTHDPYHILVSETMLQQTQVDRVIPKYREWLDKFPTFAALAAADLDEIRATWKGLGYNIRPLRLQAVAQLVTLHYGGQLPHDVATLRALPGIGRYTAGAVASFAFRLDEPILDTNVRRVLFRVFCARGAMRTTAMEHHLWDVSTRVLPKGKAWEFNSALMDFGALICTARQPKCPLCPLASFCKSTCRPGKTARRSPAAS
ncbi:MAG TPA: A/G-specific adenine glycosylase [Armatimonadota bacterium]|nr:A/G-specific adenine glycosylase [Armatimonadota bacterium]